MNQKQLHNVHRDSWADDLAIAHNGIAMLEFYSTVDPLAAKYADLLGAFYIDLVARNTKLTLMRSANNNTALENWTVSEGASESGYIPTQFDGNHLFTIPSHISPERINISVILTQLLSYPFGDTHAFTNRERASEIIYLNGTGDWESMAERAIELLGKDRVLTNGDVAVDNHLDER
jgi:hypothetical protein